MLEIPEAIVISQQLNETIKGKTIQNVTMLKSPHKFAWFYGDPENYHDLIMDMTVGTSRANAGQIEIDIEDMRLLFNDGVNLRFFGTGEKTPEKHQLDIEFTDNSHLIGSIQMYGGISLFKNGENDNPYYLVAKEKPIPIYDDFTEAYFIEMLKNASEKLSIKAFLATEQRIPGLGNGVLQDILFNAGIHPKRKLSTLNDKQIIDLFKAVKDTLIKMTFEGGRDTEKDLFGCTGGYKTILSKNTVNKACQICGNLIKKEAYMGGSIYYCDGCQKI
jgi:formamidopyrimidine-DNA glycosylase